MMSIPSTSPTVDSKRTYLDLLPHDALHNVLRHMSAYPRRMCWTNFISPEDARALYCGEGALTEVARASLTIVDTWWYGRIEAEGAVFLTTSSGMCVLPDVLAETGQTLTEMTIRKITANMEVSSWVDSFVTNCLSVKKLTLLGIGDPSGRIVEALLQATSGSIVSLGVDGVHLDAVVAHCVGLRELKMFKAPKHVGNLWRTVGPTLENLCLSGVWKGGADGLRAMQKSCRSLRSVDIWVEAKDHAAYAECCASYGSQLQFADLGSMPEILCSKVVDACSNIRCISQLGAVQQMECLGPHLSALEANFEYPEALDELAQAAAHCTNIEKMTISFGGQSGSEIMHALLSVKKTKMSVLALSLSESTGYDVLQVVGSFTGSLQHFEFAGILPEKGAFRNVANANRQLEKVEIWVTDVPFVGNPQMPSLESLLVDIVESFAVSPALFELMVVEEDSLFDMPLPAVTRACNRLRYRSTRVPHVQIFGVDYLK